MGRARGRYSLTRVNGAGMPLPERIIAPKAGIPRRHTHERGPSTVCATWGIKKSLRPAQMQRESLYAFARCYMHMRTQEISVRKTQSHTDSASAQWDRQRGLLLSDLSPGRSNRCRRCSERTWNGGMYKIGRAHV